MDNNYLFLAMQTGGQLSPEQLQRAQQMGQLPQMEMGAGLNDIQKMNMQQAEHYGMFRRGGVPKNYAEGGEQEEIDQEYMSPYVKYNQRVSEFLENLKSTAMGALQDEMMGVNDDYAQEADQIEMEQAQYGREVSQSTINPQGINAVNAWLGAAQNTKDLTKPLAQTAGLASGLKGYFGGDQASYEANPFNSAWNPTRLTTTNKETGEKTVTRAGKDGFAYGGQYFQPGGQAPYWSPEEMAYLNALPKRDRDTLISQGDAGKAQVQAAMQGQAQVANLPKTVTKNKASAANTNKTAPNANNNTNTATTATTAATTATTNANPSPTGTEVVTNSDGSQSSISPEEVARRKAEADAKAETTPNATTTTTQPNAGTGEVDYLAMLADPTGQNAGGVYGTDRNGNPIPMAFYDPNMRLNKMTADYRNNAASWFRKNKRPGQMKSLSFDFTTGTQSPATQVPSITGPNAPIQPSAGGPQTSTGTNSPVQTGQGTTVWNPQDYLPASIRAALQNQKNGGSLHKAQNGVEVLPANQGYDTGWAPIGQEKRAPEDRVNPNVQMSQDFNKQKYGEPLKINDTDSFTAKYDKNKKENPFFAPAMLAGLNLAAGASGNIDAKKKEKQLRNKLSYDQIYSANPETSGSRGDWTANEGYFRPNDMVPTQFTGNGMQMAQNGGAYSEGDELYLDEDAIQSFLAAGGQLDYLD